MVTLKTRSKKPGRLSGKIRGESGLKGKRVKMNFKDTGQALILGKQVKMSFKDTGQAFIY